MCVSIAARCHGVGVDIVVFLWIGLVVWVLGRSVWWVVCS